jgi:arylsulfatase B
LTARRHVSQGRRLLHRSDWHEAVSIIYHHDTAKPLFLYVASLAPHAPYQAPQDSIDGYKDLAGNIHRHTYAAMITDLDTQVGRIVDALKQKDMLDNTLIIFSSDNGGATSALFATGARSPEEREESGGVGFEEKPPASNGNLRGGKGALHEGGVRVPTIFIGRPSSSRGSWMSRWLWST